MSIVFIVGTLLILHIVGTVVIIESVLIVETVIMVSTVFMLSTMVIMVVIVGPGSSWTLLSL